MTKSYYHYADIITMPLS